MSEHSKSAGNGGKPTSSSGKTPFQKWLGSMGEKLCNGCMVCKDKLMQLGKNIRTKLPWNKTDETDPASAPRKRKVHKTPLQKMTKLQLGIFIAQCVLSLVSVLYLIGIVWLSVYCLLYRLEIPEAMRTAFCVRISLICFGLTAAMVFTRRQILTRFCVMAAMPFYFIIFLFNYQYLVLLIPLGLMGVITFFANGTKEGTKTILGSIFLMIYVLGAFCYLTVIDLLKPSSIETVAEQSISPSGTYRCQVIEVQDTADGNTYVSMEPNTYDRQYDHCTWYAMGYDKRIYLERPKTEFKTEWKTETREEITKQLRKLNPNAVFTLNSAQMEILGLHIGYTDTYKASSLTKSQRMALGICIEKDLLSNQTAEDLGLTLYEKTQTITIGYEQLLSLGLEVSYDMPLADLTETQLATLGVPAENDVLYVNGKAVFRQYIAILENTFVPSVRSYGYLLE